jgi:hypothetical protein
MVDSRKGITNLHVPNNVIIDASMPVVVRDGGTDVEQGRRAAGHHRDGPDRCYATMYQAVLEDCQRHGQFDPATMGSVANVGLMAKKAEEYGSHDKTFMAEGDGTIRVLDADGNVCSSSGWRRATSSARARPRTRRFATGSSSASHGAATGFAGGVLARRRTAATTPRSFARSSLPARARHRGPGAAS